MTSRRSLVGAVAAIGGLACAPTGASAITIDSVSTQPTATQAGSHPSFRLSMRFRGGSTPKSLVIRLPPGLVGNPNAAAKCPQATFQAGGCGADSVVGTTTVSTNAGLGSGDGAGAGGGSGSGGSGSGGLVCTLLPVLCNGLTRATTGQLSPTVPLTADGTVYDLEPGPGEPARLGIAVRPLAGLLGEIRLQSPIEVRDGSDFGLTSSLDGLPSTFNGLATQITGLDLTLNGTTASGQPFLTLPTSCATATTTVSVTPYSGASDTASASFTPTGCAAVPFTPGLRVVPETGRVDSPSGFAVQLGLSGEEVPIRQAHVAAARVTLPLGTGLNPGTAVGLRTCSDAAFAKGSRAAPTCPAASVVGEASFTSPLVGTLTGTVYEGDPKPGQMLRLLVDVPGPGLRIKLVGDVDPDPRTGQVSSTFADLPQLPFTGFTLRFRGGDRAILTTPPSCGPATSGAVLTPYSGTAPARAASAFDVDWDGQGTACPDPLPFAPSIGASVDPSTAGAPTTAITTVARQDRTQRLGDVAIAFPPGLLGGLGAGIELCDLDQARAARCPAASRVGSATLVAGPGGAPLRIDGDVFLTGPIDGSLAGLAITVPGKVGPFDLGTTVSFARIAARPGDSGLDVTAKGLPQIVGGIPLGLRQIRLTLDRQGFMRNATSCAAQQLHASFTSALGATATAAAAYQATACDRVPFQPRLSGIVATKRQLAAGAHPKVTAVVRQRAGEIATRAVTVTLPRGIGADVRNLNRTCFEGRDCGTRNIVGRATAATPLLPVPLTGEVRLVTPTGGGLPQLRLHLSGLLSLTLVGKTALSNDGRVVNTFEGIPDVPLSRFALTIDGGKGGILRNLRRLRCGGKLVGNADFTGHSGARRVVMGSFRVCGTSRTNASRRDRAPHTPRGSRKR